MNFYISDYHLGHENSIKFDNRPFDSLEDMHACIIAQWNAVVRQNDTVYILGDFAWKSSVGIEIIRKLRGKKVLVKGNHDHFTDELKSEFKSIADYMEISDEQEKIILCHYPIAHWNKADHGSIHLHGHIHMSRDSEPFEEYKELMRQRGLPYRCYNIGCMLPYMNYTPKTLKQILSECEQTQDNQGVQ